MNAEPYKYDVAFSFCVQDEPLANQLNDLLQDRVSTFLYSRKQGEIAGTDGEKTFNTVFGKESRVVVVLYRRGWGETKWTRIEETAIRRRGYEHGYDFAVFVPLDEPATVPDWLPPTRLWVGLNRWGIEGAASVIEARVQEQGGELHEETVRDRAARLKRALEFEATREKFLRSEEGVNAANAQFECLLGELGRLSTEAGESVGRTSFKLKSDQHQLVIVGLGVGLSIEWRYYCANDLDEAKLIVSLWKGHPPFPGAILLKQPPRIRETQFTFALVLPDQHRWIEVGGQRRTYTTHDLATRVLKELMDQVEMAQRRG